MQGTGKQAKDESRAASPAKEIQPPIPGQEVSRSSSHSWGSATLQRPREIPTKPEIPDTGLSTTAWHPLGLSLSAAQDLPAQVGAQMEPLREVRAC